MNKYMHPISIMHNNTAKSIPRIHRISCHRFTTSTVVSQNPIRAFRPPQISNNEPSTSAKTKTTIPIGPTSSSTSPTYPPDYPLHRHPATPLKDQASRLASFLSNNKGRILCITGAGISTDSSIPDYRGQNGIYTRDPNYRPIFYQEFVSSHATRQRYWARSTLGWRTIQSAQPNISHSILADLEIQNYFTKRQSLITQNVDHLHTKSGMQSVLELHGTLHTVQCTSCRQTIPRQDFQTQLRELNPFLEPFLSTNHQVDVASSTTNTSGRVNPDGDMSLEALTPLIPQIRYPTCSSCKGVYKPSVTFFGENLDPNVRAKSIQWVNDAEALLVMGTSLQVFSAYRLILEAWKDSAKPKSVAMVNVGMTRLDESLLSGRLSKDYWGAFEKYESRTGELLPLVKELL